MQWLNLGDGNYIQVTETVRHLPVGTYAVGVGGGNAGGASGVNGGQGFNTTFSTVTAKGGGGGGAANATVSMEGRAVGQAPILPLVVRQEEQVPLFRE